MKRLIAALILLLLIGKAETLHAQDFSNKGKEFWIAYSYHVGMSGGGSPVMTLYLTSDVTTTYSVDIYGSANIASGSITGGAVVSVTVPITYAINGEGSFSQKAIHVTSASPIVVYAYITRSAASAATLCLPATVLGKEYVSSSFTQVSNEANSNSYVTVVGVEDNTTVEIRPSANTKNGWLAGQTYQVTLNKGEIYQILGFANASQSSAQTFLGNDLSGTWVRSVSTGTAGCKRIAVFSGSGKIRIPNANCGNSSDNLYQQLYPTGTWGKKYLSVPSNNNFYNYYRVYRKDPSTQLRVNGNLIPASSFTNDYYEMPGANNTPNLFEADQPISVAQYFTTQGCSGNSNSVPNDPDMIMLNPVEQNINNVTLVSSNLAAASTTQYPHQHHIHVIIKNTGTGISSFRFDGSPVPASSWTVHPQDPTYSYAYLSDPRVTTGVSQGYHTLSSDSGFLALAYGYANAESYGYSAGANVKDLYQFASIRNDFATVNYPATCRNTPFKFSMTFPYQPTQIIWQFNGLFTDVTINNPVPDSSYQVGGKTVYRYTLPGQYSAPNVGTFPIRILATGATSDGCGGEQEINYELQVLERPLASFTFTTSGCVTEPVQFTDNSNGQGRPFILYNWFLGNTSTTSSAQNPTYTFPAAGNYPVKHLVITDIGCVSDTVTQIVSLSQPPTANFGVAAPYCVGKPLSFTDTSIANGGTLTNWQWNFGDGSAVVNAATGAAQTHTYATAGTYTITLQVTASGGCRSLVFSRTITVGVNPTAGFSFGNACLPSGALSFTNSSTVSGGGTLTYQWNFGPAGATSTATNPTYNYSATGPYNVSLVATTAGGCTDTARKTVNTIYARPSSAFSPSATPVSGKYCRNSTITFTSNAAAPASTISEYHWDFGDNTQSTQQNPTKTYGTAGTYIVKHWVVSAIGCGSDTTQLSIQVVALPVASFTVSAHRCTGDPITLTSNSDAVAAGSSIVSYDWLMNGNPPAGTQLPTMTLIPASAADQVVALTVHTDVGCTDDTTVTIAIHPKPVPDFTLPNVCLPIGTATFTNTTTIADGTLPQVTYQWTFGDGGNSTQVNPSHNFSGTGPFDIHLTATSSNGCVKDTLKQLTTVFAQPHAPFTADKIKSCVGNTFTFTSNAAATGSTVSEWHWSFGDNTSSTQQNPTKVYSTPGTYTVKHWIVSAAGCYSDTSQQQVTVLAQPVASFTVDPHRCERDTLRLTSNSNPSGGVISQYSWSVDGTAQSSTTPALPYYPGSAATYAIRLTITTDIGCSDDTTVNVLVHPKPVPDFTLPNVCLPAGTATFTNTTTIADGSIGTVTYQWTFGDGGSSSQASPTHNYSNVGPFNVHLTATSNQGCVQDTTKQLTTVYAPPQAAFAASSAEVCVGAAFTFTDASTAPASSVTQWDWDFGDGTAHSNQQNPTHTYATPGAYVVRLTVTSAIGCVSAPVTHSVTVNRLPTAQFVIGAPMCVTKNVTFTDASQANSGTLQSWSWNFGDGSAPVTGQGPQQHAYAAVGNYGVTLTVTTDKGCTANVTDSARVHPLPQPGFIVPQNCLNDPYSEFIDTSHVAAPDVISAWSWNFGDNLSAPANNVSTQQNPRHRFTAVGPYQVKLTVTTNNGCSADTTQQVTIAGTSPVPVLTVLKNTVCTNDSVRIKDSSWVDIGRILRVDIWWDASDPSSVETILNPTIATIYAHKYPEMFSPALRALNIKLVAYSGQTCAVDISKPLTLLATPDVRFAPVTGVCENVPAFNLTQASWANQGTVPGVGVFSGNGVSSTGLFTPSNAGLGLHPITYTVTGTNGCANDTTMPIAVYGVPTVSAGPDKFILEGGVDTLEGSGTGNSLLFVWTPARWLSDDSIARPACRPQGDQNYTLTVISADGCTNSDQVYVKMLKMPTIPNVFTPNGDGVNDRWVIQYLESYPGATIEIFNRYGQRVYQSVNYTNPWDGTLNGQPLPTGTYYYVINPKNGRQQMAGFVDLIR